MVTAYVSYTRNTKGLAQRVSTSLSQSGIACGLDEGPGEMWPSEHTQKLEDAIESATLYLLPISPGSATERWQDYERRALLRKLWDDPTRRALVLLTPGAECPAFVSDQDTVQLSSTRVTNEDLSQLKKRVSELLSSTPKLSAATAR